MSGAIPPFPLYVFMAWYLLKHGYNYTFIFCCINNDLPVPVAAMSKARTVWDCSDTRIVGWNPPRGMDVYPRFPV
jgi:hypothetical protein